MRTRSRAAKVFSFLMRSTGGLLPLLVAVPGLAGDGDEDGAVLITDDVREEAYPEWSPDGNTIVFRANWPDLDPDSETPPNHNLWTIPASGGVRLDATQITNHSAYDDMPDFHPDGDRVVFISGREHGDFSDIYVVSAVGEPEGAVVEALTSDPSVVDIGPRFSPDGTRIAICSNRSGFYQIWVMDADGSDLTQITFTATGAARPAWSPNGDEIAYVSEDEGSFDIWRVPAEGGESVRVTANPAAENSPSWSPDATAIAFASLRAGNNDIYLVTLASGAERRITLDPAIDSQPAFSPDGDQIAFGSERLVDPPGPGEKSIWIVDVLPTPTRSVSWGHLKSILGR
jgi:Tol biopolymer transport system component